MSKYTTEVRFICETRAGLRESAGYMSIDEILEKSAPKIFDFDFPIFDEAYRLPLEIKILKHYYTREIGAETVGLWKLWLNQRMNEIMPYYNELYTLKKDALLNKDKIFYDKDITTARSVDDTGKTTTKADGNSESSQSADTYSNSTSLSAYSDTPQGSLSGVRDLKYLTNATKTDDDSSETTSAKGHSTSSNNSVTDMTSTQAYVEHTIGMNGGKNYFTIYKEMYESLVNIDMKIIDELADLFFGLW